MTTLDGDVTADQNPPWSRSGRQPRIAIIGAGMSGIAAVVKLRKAGYTDLTVYEKTDRVGGTWRENTYPGLSCDVPSRWYSFSFALKADWAHRYSYGPDIQAYMESVARDFSVTDCVIFDTTVTDLTYDAPRWQLTTSTGAREEFDVVISATGLLHQPVYPDIAGLHSFAGNAFHSARWDHSVDLRGKRVGIIGTGSTACQIVGAITDQVAQMHVFQRTPHWVAPLPQKAYSPFWNRLLAKYPFMQWVVYNFYYRLMVHTFSAATVGNKMMQRWMSQICDTHLAESVPDPELRAKLTPDYQATCKRMIFCSDYYPALTRSHSRLVTERIANVEASGVRTVDGVLHELDILVLATGFNAAAFILPTRVTGENGIDLEQQWDDAPRAHRSVAVPGFPNLWFLGGPTGPVGNLSLIAIAEHQIDYIISMLDRMKSQELSAIAPTQTAFDEYNAAMRDAIKHTIWFTGGCKSWYIDKSGLPNLYPWFPVRYLHEMRKPVFAEYRLIK